MGLAKALLFALLSWVGCVVAGEVGVTDNSILIGMTAPFSGPSGPYGLDMKMVINAYFRQVNESGGIHGRKPVSYTHLDVYKRQVKKSLAEYGKELSDSEKGVIEAAMKEAEEAIRGADLDAIRAKTEALGTAAQKLGEKMYAKQNADGAEGAAGHAAGEAKKDDSDVVDAEFTEVKDKK